MLIQLAALLSAVGLAAAAPTATLTHRAGDLLPGGKVLAQVEVTWEGRPEEHLLGTPTVDAPRDGSIRMGRTTSRFDGTHTTWTVDVVVELPDRGSRWTVGPARVPIKGGPLAGRELTADAIRIGAPDAKRRGLIAQGIGNGAVVLVVLVYVWYRWRSLTDLETSAP
jgi:hypothetical protein